MRAILINAGQGSRLLPLTLHTPKCLIEVNGRTILDHQIEALKSAGVKRIEVVGGYRAEQIREHLARHYDPAFVGLTINPFWSVASSISSVWAVRELLDQPFVLVNGDTVFDASVFQHAIAEMQPGVNLVVERLGQPENDDMLVRVHEQRIVAVGKHLAVSEATHRSLGIVLSPDHRSRGLYHCALRTVIEAEGGYNAYHHGVIDHLARTAGVTAIENHGGLWREVDRPEDIERWTREHGGGSWPKALP
jgi:choline kinase